MRAAGQDARGGRCAATGWRSAPLAPAPGLPRRSPVHRPTPGAPAHLMRCAHAQLQTTAHGRLGRYQVGGGAGPRNSRQRGAPRGHRPACRLSALGPIQHAPQPGAGVGGACARGDGYVCLCGDGCTWGWVPIQVAMRRPWSACTPIWHLRSPSWGGKPASFALDARPRPQPQQWPRSPRNQQMALVPPPRLLNRCHGSPPKAP